MNPLDRRGFIGMCGGAVACLAAGGCASVMAQRVTAVDGRVRLPLARHSELAAPGGALTIQPEGLADQILVLRVGDGQFAALSPICTHRGCTVEPAGDRLKCPCHGSTYDREGKVLIGPAERALTRYPAAVEGGTLVITLGLPR